MPSIPVLGLPSVMSLLSSSVLISSELPVSSEIKQHSYVNANIIITCSTDVLKCYRRQAIPMKQAKLALRIYVLPGPIITADLLATELNLNLYSRIPDEADV